MKRDKYHIGRVRIAAAKILSENLGFEVRPEHIQPASGRARTDWRLDLYRWEIFTYDNGVPVVAGCWERLTDFVKVAKSRGCLIRYGEVTYGDNK